VAESQRISNRRVKRIPRTGFAPALAALCLLLAVAGGPVVIDKLRVVKEQDWVAYPMHTALATVLNRLGIQPAIAMTQWVKAGYHARSTSEIEVSVNGLVVAAGRIPNAQLDPGLCQIFNTDAQPVGGWGGGLWPIALREQFAALSRANRACPEAAIWGQIPDDIPITYHARPPTAGIFHNTWYPTYGVAPAPVPTAAWLHNLAHGAVVLLYHCPDGCPDVLAQAAQLQAELPLGRNPRAGGASLLVTGSDDMDYYVAVVAWGHLLPLERFDRNQIEAFYEANVDRGPECEHLVCPD
jgi:hypothetical protein